MDMILKVSQDSHTRKYMMQMETVHGLIPIALSSCMEQKQATNSNTNSVSEEQAYAKDAAMALYNLANFNRPKFYIPGETVRQARDRRKFILWGGLLALYHISNHTKVKEIEEFCEGAGLKELDLRNHEDLVRVMKLYLESMEESTKGKATLVEPALVRAHKLSDEEKGDSGEAAPGQEELSPGSGGAKQVNLDTSVPEDVAFPE